MANVSQGERSLPLQTTEDKHKTCKVPPLAKKVEFAIHMYSLQAILSVPLWVRSWKEFFDPPRGGPDIIKAYGCRPRLAVRIFFPAKYDKTSPHPLSTVFSIHGGGFCIGVSRDDDEYNRAFADSHNVLVVALNYSKAPAEAFPTALYDLEVLYHAVLGDESLPISRAGNPSGDGHSRVAVLGFSAGGNLALALSQLTSIRESVDRPSAVISIYGCLDLARHSTDKLRNRFYKPALPLPQGSRVDPLATLAPIFDWCYVPYGHDLTDPLLSPGYAPRSSLPPHIFLVGAELDMLAHESWRLACRLANEDSLAHGRPITELREVPDPDSKVDRIKCVGRRASSKRKGALEPPGDERFGWREKWQREDGSTTSINWLLVPDAIHGFDNANIRRLMGGKEAVLDAEMKTRACVYELGQWLHNVVWKT